MELGSGSPWPTYSQPFDLATRRLPVPLLDQARRNYLVWRLGRVISYALARFGAASVMRVFSAGILFALEGRRFFPGRSRKHRLRRTHLNGNRGFRNAFLMRLRRGRLRQGRRTHAHGTDSRVCGQWDELRRPHCALGLLAPLRYANGLPLRCGRRRSSDDPPGLSLVSRSAPAELSRFVRTSARRK